MKSEKDEIKKYLKSSSIERVIDEKEIGLELKTNLGGLKNEVFNRKSVKN